MRILLLFIAISSYRVESAMNQQHMLRMTAMSRMRNPTPFRPGLNLRWNQKQLGSAQRNPFMYYRGAPNRYNKFPQSNPPLFNANTWKASPRQPPVSTVEADTVRAAATAAVNLQQQQQPNQPLQQQQINQPLPQQSLQQQPFQHQQQPFQQQQQPFQQHQQPFLQHQQPFQQQQQPFQQQQQQQQQHRFSQNGGTDAIHTIPAPNLSFSEKPIVVLENTGHIPTSIPAHVTSVTPRPIFNFNNHKQNSWKDPSPIKFGPKPPSDTRFFNKGPSAPDLSSFMRNAAALQFASEYGFNTMTLPPTSIGSHQTFHHHTPLPVQGFQGISNPHEFLPTGVNSIIIPPTMYSHTPNFMQHLQKQLLQRYPAVEFVPYHFDQTHQIQLEPQQSQQSQVFVANSITPAPLTQLTVIPLKNETKTQVVRETPEATATGAPQELVSNNVTQNIIESVSITDPQNATVPTIAEPVSTESAKGTEKPITVSTENYNTTPLFYAQVGQSIGNFEANGLYTAINDVRAASLMADSSQENGTSTTEHPDLKTYFIHSTETDENNNTINDIKPLLGVPFTKSDTVKIAYTLVRNGDKNIPIGKDGSVYAGQIVEASISDDAEFIKEKAEMLGRRPPIRLVATTSDDKQTTVAPKLTVVKAKIPPRSKLTFDDRTGEPILRIYASYLDSPLQKEIITSKLASIKHVKETSARKEVSPLEWSRDTYKSITKHTNEPRTSQYGHTEKIPTTRAERTQPISHSARIQMLAHTERTQPSTVTDRGPVTFESKPETSERTKVTSESMPQSLERVPQTSERLPQSSERVPQTSERVPQSSERVPQTSERVPQTSERVPQTSEAVPQTSEKVPPTSERVPPTSERVLQTSEIQLLTSETLSPSENVPTTSERYTQSNIETTAYKINTAYRSRPFERRTETTPSFRPERKTTESSRDFERAQVMQRDSYSKVSQFGHGHSRRPTEHSSIKPISGRGHDNAIETDRKLNSEINVGSFGLKLKSRMDDIVPIFDDY